MERRPMRGGGRGQDNQRRTVALVAVGLAVLLLVFWLNNRSPEKPQTRPDTAQGPTGSTAPASAQQKLSDAAPENVPPPPPALPPASTGAVAFASAASGGWEVYGVLPDGSDFRQLTQLAASEPPVFIALSPEGLRVLFGLRQQGSVTAFMVDTAAKEPPRRFSNAEPGEMEAAQWSPDPQQPLIAAAVRVGGVSHLYVVRPDGTGWQRLAEGPVAAPTWDSQGVRIAYICGGAICQTTRFGGTPERLVDLRTAVPPSALAWSPDGRYIAYTMESQVWVYGVQERGRVAVTQAEGGWRYREPGWSADSQRIVLVRYREGEEPHLFMIAPDGSAGQRLFTSLITGPVAWPSWSGETLK